MKLKYALLTCLLLIGNTIACGEDETHSRVVPTPNDAPDMSNTQAPDSTVDQTDDTPDTTPDQTTCTPRTECPANTCGDIDDGCGGTIQCGAPKSCDDVADGCGLHDNGCGGLLDCGQCLCDNGEPAVERCGPCGLGVVTCTGTKQGVCSTDTNPVLKDLDSNTCDPRLIFVDSRAMLGGDGSQTAPYRMISNVLKSSPIGSIIILANNAPHNQTIEIKEGVHLLGGFNRAGDRWISTSTATQLEPSYVTGKNQIAINAQDIIAPTHLSGLSVRSADAQQDGNSIGLLAKNSSGLILSDVTIDAGQGGQGADGADGAAGSAGGDALDGGMGAIGSHNVYNTQVMLAQGGKRGVNAVCPTADGGDGAHSVGQRQDGSYYHNQPENAASTKGEEGTAGQTLVRTLLFPNNTLDTPNSGKHGFTGTIGAAGPGGTSDLQWADGLVVNGRGEDGQPGTHGGGGGGGGAHALYSYWNLHRDGDPMLVWSWSPSGGGGGAGGCGGAGGQGGAPGGASIGAILVASDVIFNDVRVTGGRGGAGGQGGLGGPGGERGDGGSGHDKVKIYNGIIGGTTVGGRRPGLGTNAITASYNTKSGSGGHGGYGGEGGNGGDGAGGPSVGIMCVASSPNAIVLNASATAGGAGAQPGKVIDMKDCD